MTEVIYSSPWTPQIAVQARTVVWGCLSSLADLRGKWTSQPVRKLDCILLSICVVIKRKTGSFPKQISGPCWPLHRLCMWFDRQVEIVTSPCYFLMGVVHDFQTQTQNENKMRTLQYIFYIETPTKCEESRQQSTSFSVWNRLIKLTINDFCHFITS